MDRSLHALSIHKLAENDPVLKRLTELHDAISRRAFEFSMWDPLKLGTPLDYWLKAETEMVLPIAIQITESDDEIQVAATAPGFSEDEMELCVEPRKVILTAKHEKSEEEKRARIVYSEYKRDEILRSIDLPVEVDPEKAKAVLHNGIVKITLAKAESARRGKKVPVAAVAA